MHGRDKMVKKIIAALLCLVLVGTLAGALNTSSGSILEETAARLTASEGGQSLSPGNEWAVLGLARWNGEPSAALFSGYYTGLTRLLDEKQGILHRNKYTEYARTVLALTAMGKNPANVGGWDLTAPLHDYDKVIRQGINGAAYALLALDSLDHPDPEIRRQYVAYLLSAQLESGGFALTGAHPDPDVTAIVLQALAAYRDQPEVAEALEKGVDRLSALQKAEGGFESLGRENAESSAQVIIALCTLNLDPRGDRFTKNGVSVVDALMAYTHEEGFLHEPGDTRANAMTAQQAFLALLALERYEQGLPALFDMADAPSLPSIFPEDYGLPGRHPDLRQVPVALPDKTFDDIAAHAHRQAIELLARRRILNGVDDSSFAPNGLITRAEYAAIIIRALGLQAGGTAAFTDIPADAWYSASVAAGVRYGILTGRKDTVFDPDGQINRQEAAVMLARAALLCGLDRQMTDSEAQDVLAQFSDYRQIASWARRDMALCYEIGVFSDADLESLPLKPATRGDLAAMTVKLLKITQLLTAE